MRASGGGVHGFGGSTTKGICGLRVVVTISSFFSSIP